jgi:predicted GNAT superfamily acetyltransferase
VKIRDLSDADADAVLRLNEESVSMLAPLDSERLRALRTIAAHALVCESDGEVAGFALAFAPGATYDSINYAWHGERFDDFLYLDRIAVSTAFRRRGIASLLYDEMESRAVQHSRMVCEVNHDPPNEASLAFHRTRGYREIGHLTQPDGHVTVMLEKPL